MAAGDVGNDLTAVGEQSQIVRISLVLGLHIVAVI